MTELNQSRAAKVLLSLGVAVAAAGCTAGAQDPVTAGLIADGRVDNTHAINTRRPGASFYEVEAQSGEACDGYLIPISGAEYLATQNGRPTLCSSDAFPQR